MLVLVLVLVPLLPLLLLFLSAKRTAFYAAAART